MSNNPLIARFAGVESLVSPEHQARFDSDLVQANLAIVAFQARDAASPAPVMSDSFWYASDDWRAAYRPYVVKDGVLQIPIKGVLLNDFSFALGSWATGYTYIWKAFERGMADPEVKGIALICHTPGGEVAGNFDLVDKMFAMKGTKPIYGFAHEAAYSAGYSIISVSDKIWISRTGGVGSIGVVTGHLDVSQAMEKAGLKFTYIFAGKHKVDGNPYEALSDDVKARIQGRIDALYDVFVSTVARNRPVLSEQEVRDTEALTFTATEAVSKKLADAIGSLDDATAAFVADLSSDDGDETMADQANTTTVDLAVHNTALAAARSEGETAGRQAERARVVAILGSDQAVERPTAALAAALETDMTVEQATNFLGKLPAEAKVEPAAPKDQGSAGGGVGGDRFNKAMDSTGNPNVGAATGGEAVEGEGGEQPSRAERAFTAAGRTRKAS